MEFGSQEHKTSPDAGFHLWKEFFNKSFQASRANSFRDRLQAVSEALDPQTLDRLRVWSPKTARRVVSYLKQNFAEELEAWTNDKMELFELEDDKRVRQVVAAARRQLNLEKV